MMLARLHALFGGRLYGPYRQNGINARYAWVLNGFELTQAVIAALWPWLGDVKRRQAKRMLLAYLAYVQRVQQEGGRKGWRLYGKSVAQV